MNKVMCNWSPHCDIESCPHKTPHSPRAERNHPQCSSKNVYCYAKNIPVNCVMVKDTLAEEEYYYNTNNPEDGNPGGLEDEKKT